MAGNSWHGQRQGEHRTASVAAVGGSNSAAHRFHEALGVP